MVRMRRVTLALGTAVSLLAALTVASVGAAGGFGQGPGKFTFNDVSGQISLFNSADQSNENLSVDRSLFIVRPKKGGAPSPQLMTTLTVSIFIPDPKDPTLPPLLNAFGCFVIPDADFVVSSNLQHATLNVTVDESNLCPGFIVPAATPADGAKQGGPGSTGFTFPLSIAATWTGNGVVSTSDDQAMFKCGNYVTHTHTKGNGALSSSAGFSLSGFDPFVVTNSFSGLNRNNVELQVGGSGVLSPECGGKGG